MTLEPNQLDTGNSRLHIFALIDDLVRLAATLHHDEGLIGGPDEEENEP